MSKKENLRNKDQKQKIIKPINYVYALLIFLGAILLAIYVFDWLKIKKFEKLQNSYLITTQTIPSVIEDLDSLSQVRQESPSKYFIYFGYTNDEYVYNLEKDLKRVIDKYKLTDEFYYFNVDKLKNKNENYIDEINKELKTNKLKKVPAIIYVIDGKIVDVLDGISNTNLKVTDFEQLLDIYEYDIVK